MQLAFKINKCNYFDPVSPLGSHPYCSVLGTAWCVGILLLCLLTLWRWHSSSFSGPVNPHQCSRGLPVPWEVVCGLRRRVGERMSTNAFRKRLSYDILYLFPWIQSSRHQGRECSALAKTWCWGLWGSGDRRTKEGEGEAQIQLHQTTTNSAENTGVP